MTQLTTHIGRIARRLTILAVLLGGTTGTAAAQAGGGTMGGGWGLFAGAMGLFGLLWMGLLVGVPLFLAYSLLTREPGSTGRGDRRLSLLRERYARGEI
jgi:putative membrane protein